MDIMYEIPSQEDTTRLKITAEMIENGIDQYDRDDGGMRRKSA